MHNRLAPLRDRIRKPDECAWTTAHVGRYMSLPLTRMALFLKLSANTVTLLAGGAWLLSLPVAVAAGWAFGEGAAWVGWSLLAAAAILWNLGYLLDLVDGNLARVYGTDSPQGFYLDYVFHLLFKPAFLSSIGVFLSLARSEPGWLVLAVLTVPANWSASESAAEHVIAQSLGKDGLDLEGLTPDERRHVLLGRSDIQQPVGLKCASRPRAVRIVAQEILSYYGQFSFFSLLAAGDAGIAALGGPAFPLMRLGLLGVGLLMLGRLPFRVLRDYRRLESLGPRPRSTPESRH